MYIENMQKFGAIRCCSLKSLFIPTDAEVKIIEEFLQGCGRSFQGQKSLRRAEKAEKILVDKVWLTIESKNPILNLIYDEKLYKRKADIIAKRFTVSDGALHCKKL